MKRWATCAKVLTNLPADWCIEIIHGPGSVEHSYHFLLGFFVPLVYGLSTKWKKAKFNSLIIRSCGPLDSIIHEIGDDRITVVDKDRHNQLVRKAVEVHNRYPSTDVLATAGRKTISVKIYGCDYPVTYTRRKFVKVGEALCSTNAIRSEMSLLKKEWTRGDARILLVQRGRGHPFYESERSEIKGAGEERRSIANHDELYRAIRREHVGCLNTMMEGLTFARQFALFSLADIIIAQHGAALANIIWARPSATVIEIFPNTLRPDQKEDNFFFNLSRCMGLRYYRVDQEHEHSEVDIEKIREMIKKSIAIPNYKSRSKLRSVVFLIGKPTMSVRRRLRSLIYRACRRAASYFHDRDGRGRLFP